MLPTGSTATVAPAVEAGTGVAVGEERVALGDEARVDSGDSVSGLVRLQPVTTREEMSKRSNSLMPPYLTGQVVKSHL